MSQYEHMCNSKQYQINFTQDRRYSDTYLASKAKESENNYNHTILSITKNWAHYTSKTRNINLFSQGLRTLRSGDRQ